MFKDVLNNYLNELKISSKELSLKSNISESVISRYRSGSRVPNEEQILKLATAIYKISIVQNIDLHTKEIITETLLNSITKDDFDYDNFSENLNELINILKININEMSRYITFDSSHISRIRYGKAKPSDPIEFSNKICNYIVTKYSTDSKLKLLSILNCTNKDIEDNNKLFLLLHNWLTNNKTNKNYINDFLNNLDDFNLNDYIKVIKFDELKVPNIPFYRVKTKNYYGIEEMKNGELDFFKGTVLSKTMEDIFMCSDMPMEDMAKDTDFGKKWMFAIAMSLKKGLHLNIIHNLNRPFNEMMLGLESWIPIYMTGQVSPYYFKDNKNNIYEQLNYVSGSCALTGECIKGNHNKGKYYLTGNSKEVEYYKEKARLLLKKANSLMDIYNDFDNYQHFLVKDSKVNGNRKRFLSTLPLFTIKDELLIDILKRNNISEDDIKQIVKYKKIEENNIKNILKNNVINDNIYILDDNDSLNFPIENIFCNQKIKYNYDEYLKHLEMTKKYKNDNYKLNIVDNKTFKNITITIIENSHVIISKNSDPVIHFVIRHPKLVSAISNFNPLVKDR
ncbi:putative phage tail component domain protein [Acholeplasma sp. CAG:878]|nr:putative phage tail component domain protein [Acholeplasma sp. CAG:878]